MKTQPVIILADGAFPETETSLHLLRQSAIVICCDGAADTLLKFGRIPDHIVGDLDSVSADTKARFPEKLVHITEQETNDLAKCFRFAAEKGFSPDYLLGASGKREDHMLGNLAQFAEFSRQFPNMKLVSDYGFFMAATGEKSFTGVPVGTQVSFFSFDPSQLVSAGGVQYPLENRPLRWWYEATLNTATQPEVSIKSSGTMPVLIYFAAPPDAGIEVK